MRGIKVLASVAALALSGWAGLASAVVVCDPYVEDGNQGPSPADISDVDVLACAGFYEGNQVVADAPTTINTVLESWGLDPVDTWIAKYDTAEGTIDFGVTMYGITVVSFHWGNYDNGGECEGQGSECNRNVSAVYMFDAGEAGVSSITLAFTQGLSNAALWVTGTPREVPEPATLALLGIGLAGIGFGARRRRKI